MRAAARRVPRIAVAFTADPTESILPANPTPSKTVYKYGVGNGKSRPRLPPATRPGLSALARPGLGCV
jgi:hypothetical protein